MQGKDFVPRQKTKHAQHSRADPSSPSQAFKKRKAQHTFPNRPDSQQPFAKPAISPGAESQQQGQKRAQPQRATSKRRKQPDVLSRQAAVSQSTTEADTAQPVQHVAPLLLPASSLDATVSGVPHTALVQHTMHQLRKTLSSQLQGQQPLQSAALSASMPSMSDTSTASAVTSTTSAQAVPVLSPFVASSQLQTTVESAAMDPTGDFQAMLSESQGNLHSTTHQAIHRPDSEGHQAVSNEEASTEQAAHAEQLAQQGNMQGPQADQAIGSRLQEGRVPEQLQLQDASAVTDVTDRQIELTQPGGIASTGHELQTCTSSGGIRETATPGNALQQLISRAQKLKLQLDRHAQLRGKR